MPPKKERLHTYDFKNLGRRAQLRSPLFDIAYAPSPSVKVACVVAKKQVKRAVDRNTVRRKIYHAWRAASFTKPYAVIIHPRREALLSPVSKISEEMVKLFATL